VRAKFEAGEYIMPIPQMADPDFKVR
jgi:hypothetical protein